MTVLLITLATASLAIAAALAIWIGVLAAACALGVIGIYLDVADVRAHAR